MLQAEASMQRLECSHSCMVTLKNFARRQFLVSQVHDSRRQLRKLPHKPCSRSLRITSQLLIRIWVVLLCFLIHGKAVWRHQNRLLILFDRCWWKTTNMFRRFKIRMVWAVSICSATNPAMNLAQKRLLTPASSLWERKILFSSNWLVETRCHNISQAELSYPQNSYVDGIISPSQISIR